MVLEEAASAPRVVHRAAALLIGSELLSGKVRDENLHPLARTLRALGIELSRVVFCSDDVETIEKDVRDLSKNFDLVITSGGVGPTHDDVTVAGVAQALGRKTASSQELSELLKRHYGEGLNEAHLLMARIPEGARLVTGRNIRWPIVVCDNVWIFPGVPELFRMKIATLREHVRGPRPFFTQEVLCDVEETEIKGTLDSLVADHPLVEIGSYPKWFDPNYKTKLCFDSRDAEAAERAAADAVQRLGKHVITAT